MLTFTRTSLLKETLKLSLNASSQRGKRTRSRKPVKEVKFEDDCTVKHEESLSRAGKLLDEATICDSRPTSNMWDDPYPDLDIYKKKQISFLDKKMINPETKSIILFPGEYTRTLGKNINIDSNFPLVKEIYDEASSILNYDLLELSINGPKHKFRDMKYQQPAVFVASFAAISKLNYNYPEMIQNCVGTAGYSIGEITALTFSGALSFSDALRLVEIRGQAQDLASNLSPGCLMEFKYHAASRIKLAVKLANEYLLINQHKIDKEVAPSCSIAAHIYPGRKIIGGHKHGIQFIKDNKKDFGISDIRILKENGAFNTQLMSPASEPYKAILEKIEIKEPQIRMYSCFNGKSYSSPNVIRRKLYKQITSPIQWEQVIQSIYRRPAGLTFPSTFICGPGAENLQKRLAYINNKAAGVSYCIKC